MVRQVRGEGSDPQPVSHRGEIRGRAGRGRGELEFEENDHLHFHKHYPVERHNTSLSLQGAAELAGDSSDIADL